MFLIGDSRRRFVVGIAIAVAAISFVYSSVERIRVSVDALAYDQIGWNIAQGNGYIEDARNSMTPERDNAIARVGPGYEFFLAALYRLFGHHTWLVWGVHALLRALTAYILYLIVTSFLSRERDGHAIGVIAMIAFGLSPDLIVLNAMVLTETLGIFLGVLSLYYVLVYHESPSYKNALLLSVVLVAAFLTRTTYILAVPFIFVMLWRWGGWRHALLSISVVTLVIAPWAIHNRQVFGKYIFTNAVGGYDLWVGNNLEATGGFVKSSEIQDVRDTHHIVELDEIGKKKYIEFLASHPVSFVGLQIRKAAIYFSLLRPTGFWPYLNKQRIQQIFIIVSSTLWTAGLLILGLAGIILLLHERWTDFTAWSLALALALQPIAVIPIIVESRYRTPLLAFSAIAAAWYIVRAYIAPTVLTRRALLISVVFFIGMTSLDVVLSWSEFAARAHQFLK